jgi:Tol biopolymer transport system component
VVTYERQVYNLALSTLGKILITPKREGNSGIYVMDADGSNIMKLTDSEGDNT